jgi:hypothetical protein
VKSVSTSSVELTVATATMSAGLILSSTYFVAESTARCTSSGCIELMSKSRTIRRRPANASGVITFGVTVSGVVTGAVAGCWPRACSAMRASAPANRSTDVGPAGLSEISSNVKLLTVCGFPSSVTSKSAAVRPRTTSPEPSRTMTSTETTCVLPRNTGRFWGACAEGTAAINTAAASDTVRRRMDR